MALLSNLKNHKKKIYNFHFTQINFTIPCPEALRQQAYTHHCESSPHTEAEVYKYANQRCIQKQPSNWEHQLSQAAKPLRGLGIGELANTPWLLLSHQSWAIWQGSILEQAFSFF